MIESKVYNRNIRRKICYGTIILITRRIRHNHHIHHIHRNHRKSWKWEEKKNQ